MTEKRKPVPKVAAMGVSGILATLIIWLLSTYGNVEVPPDMAALLATIFAFVSGYMMHDKKAKKIKNDYEEFIRNFPIE